MAPASGRGGEKIDQAVSCRFDADEAAAKSKHIGVVMLARQPRGQAVVAQRGSNTRMTVRRNRDANAGTADENTAPPPPLHPPRPAATAALPLSPPPPPSGPP